MKKRCSRAYVISVLVSDRVGILRDITAAVSDLGADIDGISQTVVRGYFTVIITAAFDQAVRADQVQSAIARNFADAEAAIVVCPYEPAGAARPAVDAERYVVTLNGRDRPGILKRVTGFLAAKGINIEDWYFRIEGASVTHIGEITVPKLLDIKQVQIEFQRALDDLEIASCIQHQNIFRATNEVGPIRALLEDGRHA